MQKKPHAVSEGVLGKLRNDDGSLWSLKLWKKQVNRNEIDISRDLCFAGIAAHSKRQSYNRQRHRDYGLPNDDQTKF